MNHIKKVAAVKRLIDEQPAVHFTAAYLASRFGGGSSQLKKAFKQQEGIGIYAYQSRKRLLLACTLIEEGGHTLKSVAKQCGFREMSNFTTAFKKVFGVSPGRWRG